MQFDFELYLNIIIIMENMNELDVREIATPDTEVNSSFEEADSNHEVFFRKTNRVKGVNDKEIVKIEDEPPKWFLNYMVQMNSNMEQMSNKMEKLRVELKEDNNSNKIFMEQKFSDMDKKFSDMDKKFSDKMEKLSEDNKRVEDSVNQLRINSNERMERIEKQCEEKAIRMENLLKNNVEKLEAKDEELSARIEDVYKIGRNNEKKLDKKIERVSKENKLLVKNVEEKLNEQIVKKCDEVQEILLKKNSEDEILNNIKLSEVSDNLKTNDEKVCKRISEMILSNKEYQNSIDLKLKEKEENNQNKILNIENQVVLFQKEINDKIDNLKSISVYDVNRKDKQVVNKYVDNICISSSSEYNREGNEVILGNKDENLTQVKLKIGTQDVNGNEEIIHNEVRQNNKINNPVMMNLIKVKAFSGESRESPLEYLNTLEELFLLCKFSEQEKLAIACNNLFAYAKEWWRSLFDKPVTFGDFRHLIMSCYWSEDRQDQVRYRISQEKYSLNKGSYIQFFRNQAVRLKGLTAFPLSERHILKILRHNLPRNIEQLLIAANCHTIEDAAEIIDAVEMSEIDSDIKNKNPRDKYDYRVNSLSILPNIPRVHNGYNGKINSRDKRYNEFINYNRKSNNGNHVKGSRNKSQEKFDMNQPTISGITTIMKRPKVNSNSQ